MAVLCEPNVSGARVIVGSSDDALHAVEGLEGE